MEQVVEGLWEWEIGDIGGQIRDQDAQTNKI